ncbi:daptomycin-sensing surface protein LiaX [Lacticaseibacillus mingshuiensis]|uniref:Daptomycin-sensing surface protein LiaX n=1 Tax=Lacticaseibacillus mingshuiensis TaxID=2799574 RepID=A0ABW4CJN2_9LACO|nr:daptomycin-sensing surface protein LiaX [Lacticaseibacillus mingshuiensis]
MNERERILDLVKQGVLTSEEALVLLENLAKAQATPAADRPEEKKAAPKPDQEPKHDAEEAALTALNTKIAEKSGSLDAAIAQHKRIADKIAANEEQIIVLDTMEDLDTLTEDKYKERGALKNENATLKVQLDELADQQDKLKGELADLSRQRRELNRQHFTDKVFPDDWQDQAKGAISDISKTVGDATSQISSLVKQTVSTVLDNVDWKDVTVKVPGIATEKFTHTFDFPTSQATIIDVKAANGDVTFRPWDQAGFRVDATIKLFGKMDAESPLQAFLDRSRIDVTDDHFIFQVPNKRIQADLVISVPKREYDHFNARLLNGSVTVDGLSGKDFYAKSTNGDLIFNGLEAVMLETDGVNGSIKIVGGTLRDVIATTVNGDLKLQASPRTVELQTVNGTIRATLASDFTSLQGSSVNGTVKLAVPATVAVNGELRTHFGTIKSRMAGVDAKPKTKALDLDRPGTGEGRIKFTTTSGNIQLKDTDLDD